jgi:glycosyltransferase involved in cell wall biosynthesis
VNDTTDVSVVICTRSRAPSLARTLTDLERQELAGLAMEVVVVDNGSVDGTAELLHLKQADLRLVSLYEGIAGKSRSLNLALSQVTGNLILFTDDDVKIGRDWVKNYVRAAEKFASCALFCGPIIPEFPSETPPWLKEHQWNTSFFGVFNEERLEGPLPDELMPFGANVAVRAKAIAGMHFRLDLGPSEMNGKLLGEDIDFARQVRAKWRDCVYIPSAPVRHHIRPEQIAPAWLYDRAFVFGRSVMMLERPVLIVTDFKPNDLALTEDGIHIDEVCLLHYYCGQLSACSPANSADVSKLRQAIDALDAGRFQAVLTPDANTVLCGFSRTRRVAEETSEVLLDS